MATRFQRLDHSEDITASNGYTDSPNFYDEPAYMYPNQFDSSPHVYADDDHRRVSHTTRKPVPQRPSPPMSMPSQQPLIDNYSDSSNLSYPEKPRRPEARHRSSGLSKTVSSIWSKARGHKGAPVSHASTPLWAAPWIHEADKSMNVGDNRTIRFFNRKRQRSRIFFHLFLQWMVTLLFCVALFATLYFYQAKAQLDTHQKYMFNAMVMGFGLCLGFAVVSGITEYANIFRWRLSSSRYWSLQQFELILGLSSQRKAWRFLWVGRTPGLLPNKAQMLVFFYVIVTLGLQIAIALLGLCYSVDDAPGQFGLKPGNVSIANVSYIAQADGVGNLGIDPYLVQSGAINSYGISGERFDVWYGNIEHNVAPLYASGLPIYTDNSSWWGYWFVDRCTDVNCTTAYSTSRYVLSTVECYENKITSGGFIDEGVTNLTYLDQDGKEWTWNYLGSEAAAVTSYYADQNATCGDRCTTVYVLNAGLDYRNDNWQPQFFQCNNTVTAVYNTENLTDSAAYQLPDEQGRLLAGAIGYTGTGFTDTTYQVHTYDASSYWSWTRLNGARMTETDMANSISHFSMSALAAMDDIGPRSFVNGTTPISAQQVNVLWLWAVVILLLVPGIQLLFLFITVIWGNKAVIRDDSFLSTASLLRPIVARLERSGCALSADEICDVLDNPALVYGVRMPDSGGSGVRGSVSSYGGAGGMMNRSMDDKEVLHLDVITEDEELRAQDLRWVPGQKMPQGRYDGLPLLESENMRRRRGSF